MAWLELLAILFSVCFETRIIEANQLDTALATISTFRDFSLYGYGVSLQRINGKASLIVGFPPATPQNGTGNLQKCRISSPATPNDTMDIACSVLPRATALPNDNIGQSFSTNPHTGAVLTCSTSSVQSCTNLNTLPGFCYILDMKSITPNWKLLDHSKTRGCPITNTVDVLFVLDGSGSVGTENFEKIKDWTNRVIDKLKVDEGIAKVAVIQFGRQVHIEIDLDDYGKAPSLQSAIREIADRGGGTYTVDALNEAREVLKNSDSFTSRGNNQVMIILTDGETSYAQRDGVLDAANDLRDIGVATYAVGVGPGPTESELRKLATGDIRSNDRVYKVTDFDNLGSIVDELQQQIENFIPNEDNI